MATNKERGGALLAVLWMSAALAAIAFSLAATIRLETARAGTNADGLRAWYLASGSVERAVQWIAWGGDYRNPDGSARFWEPNSSRLSLRYPSGEAIVEMIPEMSKLNVNFASPDDLRRVVLALTDNPAQADEITAGIVNWRSAPGPQSGLDLAPGQTFRPRHASLEEIEELLLVPGVTPELFYGNYVSDTAGRAYPHGGLRDCLSVWGSAGPFDVNTAAPALLEALGIPREGVASVLARRVQKPFRSTGELAELGVTATRLGIGGNLIWTLRASARLRSPDGRSSDMVRSASAVVKILDRTRYYLDPVHVLRYYDDAWSQFSLTPPATTALGAPVK